MAVAISHEDSFPPEHLSDLGVGLALQREGDGRRVLVKTGQLGDDVEGDARVRPPSGPTYKVADALIIRSDILVANCKTDMA